MSEIKFSKNFSDHSVHSGTDAGFQFEFYCERCNDAWRSEFSPFRGGQASSWLGRAAGMFGGVLGKAHDAAFVAAIEQAKIHFHRCARCMKFVCDACWNKDKGLCRECAPDAEVEIEAARAAGEVYAAGEKAALEGIQQGKKMDVRSEERRVGKEG